MLYFNGLWKKSNSNAIETDLFMPFFFFLVAACGLVEERNFGSTNTLFGVSVGAALQGFDFYKHEKNSSLYNQIYFCFPVSVVSFPDAVSTFLEKCRCGHFCFFSLL